MFQYLEDVSDGNLRFRFAFPVAVCCIGSKGEHLLVASETELTAATSKRTQSKLQLTQFRLRSFYPELVREYESIAVGTAIQPSTEAIKSSTSSSKTSISISDLGFCAVSVSSATATQLVILDLENGNVLWQLDRDEIEKCIPQHHSTTVVDNTLSNEIVALAWGHYQHASFLGREEFELLFVAFGDGMMISFKISRNILFGSRRKALAERKKVAVAAGVDSVRSRPDRSPKTTISPKTSISPKIGKSVSSPKNSQQQQLNQTMNPAGPNTSLEELSSYLEWQFDGLKTAIVNAANAAASAAGSAATPQDGSTSQAPAAAPVAVKPSKILSLETSPDNENLIISTNQRIYCLRMERRTEELDLGGLGDGDFTATRQPHNFHSDPGGLGGMSLGMVDPDCPPPVLTLVPIGSKPHDGSYTACSCRPGHILCSRPGGRLWLAETDTGKVQSTLRFDPDRKDLLAQAWGRIQYIEGVLLTNLESSFMAYDFQSLRRMLCVDTKELVNLPRDKKEVERKQDDKTADVADGTSSSHTPSNTPTSGTAVNTTTKKQFVSLVLSPGEILDVGWEESSSRDLQNENSSLNSQQNHKKSGSKSSNTSHRPVMEVNRIFAAVDSNVYLWIIPSNPGKYIVPSGNHSIETFTAEVFRKLFLANMANLPNEQILLKVADSIGKFSQESNSASNSLTSNTKLFDFSLADLRRLLQHLMDRYGLAKIPSSFEDLINRLEVNAEKKFPPLANFPVIDYIMDERRPSVDVIAARPIKVIDYYKERKKNERILEGKSPLKEGESRVAKKVVGNGFEKVDKGDLLKREPNAKKVEGKLTVIDVDEGDAHVTIETIKSAEDVKSATEGLSLISIDLLNMTSADDSKDPDGSSSGYGDMYSAQGDMQSDYGSAQGDMMSVYGSVQGDMMSAYGSAQGDEILSAQTDGTRHAAGGRSADDSHSSAESSADSSASVEERAVSAEESASAVSGESADEVEKELTMSNFRMSDVLVMSTLGTSGPGQKAQKQGKENQDQDFITFDLYRKMHDPTYKKKKALDLERGLPGLFPGSSPGSAQANKTSSDQTTGQAGRQTGRRGGNDESDGPDSNSKIGGKKSRMEKIGEERYFADTVDETFMSSMQDLPTFEDLQEIFGGKEMSAQQIQMSKDQMAKESKQKNLMISKNLGQGVDKVMTGIGGISEFLDLDANLAATLPTGMHDHFRTLQTTLEEGLEKGLEITERFEEGIHTVVGTGTENASAVLNRGKELKEFIQSSAVEMGAGGGLQLGPTGSNIGANNSNNQRQRESGDILEEHVCVDRPTWREEIDRNTSRGRSLLYNGDNYIAREVDYTSNESPIPESFLFAKGDFNPPLITKELWNLVTDTAGNLGRVSSNSDLISQWLIEGLKYLNFCCDHSLQHDSLVALVVFEVLCVRRAEIISPSTSTNGSYWPNNHIDDIDGHLCHAKDRALATVEEDYDLVMPGVVEESDSKTGTASKGEPDSVFFFENPFDEIANNFQNSFAEVEAKQQKKSKSCCRDSPQSWDDFRNTFPWNCDCSNETEYDVSTGIITTNHAVPLEESLLLAWTEPIALSFCIRFLRAPSVRVAYRANGLKWRKLRDWTFRPLMLEALEQIDIGMNVDSGYNDAQKSNRKAKNANNVRKNNTPADPFLEYVIKPLYLREYRQRQRNYLKKQDAERNRVKIDHESESLCIPNDGYVNLFIEELNDIRKMQLKKTEKNPRSLSPKSPTSREIPPTLRKRLPKGEKGSLQHTAGKIFAKAVGENFDSDETSPFSSRKRSKSKDSRRNSRNSNASYIKNTNAIRRHNKRQLSDEPGGINLDRKRVRSDETQFQQVGKGNFSTGRGKKSDLVGDLELIDECNEYFFTMDSYHGILSVRYYWRLLLIFFYQRECLSVQSAGDLACLYYPFILPWNMSNCASSRPLIRFCSRLYDCLKASSEADHGKTIIKEKDVDTAVVALLCESNNNISSNKSPLRNSERIGSDDSDFTEEEGDIRYHYYDKKSECKNLFDNRSPSSSPTSRASPNGRRGIGHVLLLGGSPSAPSSPSPKRGSVHGSVHGVNGVNASETGSKIPVHLQPLANTIVRLVRDPTLLHVECHPLLKTLDIPCKDFYQLSLAERKLVISYLLSKKFEEKPNIRGAHQSPQYCPHSAIFESPQYSVRSCESSGSSASEFVIVDNGTRYGHHDDNPHGSRYGYHDDNSHDNPQRHLGSNVVFGKNPPAKVFDNGTIKSMNYSSHLASLTTSPTNEEVDINIIRVDNIIRCDSPNSRMKSQQQAVNKIGTEMTLKNNITSKPISTEEIRRKLRDYQQQYHGSVDVDAPIGKRSGVIVHGSQIDRTVAIGSPGGKRKGKRSDEDDENAPLKTGEKLVIPASSKPRLPDTLKSVLQKARDEDMDFLSSKISRETFATRLERQNNDHNTDHNISEEESCCITEDDVVQRYLSSLRLLSCETKPGWARVVLGIISQAKNSNNNSKGDERKNPMICSPGALSLAKGSFSEIPNAVSHLESVIDTIHPDLADSLLDMLWMRL